MTSKDTDDESMLHHPFDNDEKHHDDDDEHCEEMWQSLTTRLTSCSAAMSKEDAATMNALCTTLTTLEQSLRCLVCHNFLDAPDTLKKCFHVFCSECIRKSLKVSISSINRQACCPVCRTAVENKDWERDLVPMPDIERIVMRYRQSVRMQLYKRIKGFINNSCQRDEYVVEKSKYFEAADDADSTDVDDSAAQFTIDLHTVTQLQQQYTDLMNKVRNNQYHPRECNGSYKKRPIYQAKKKQDLQEMCAQEGLSTLGSDTVLKNRHELFITLYNSHCKSTKPWTAKQCAKEVHRRELEASKAKFDYKAKEDQSMLKRLIKTSAELQKDNKPSDEATSGNHNWDQQFNNSFAKLIAEGKAKLKKDSTKKVTDNDTSSDKTTDNPLSTNGDSSLTKEEQTETVCKLSEESMKDDTTTVETFPQVVESSLKSTRITPHIQETTNKHATDRTAVVKRKSDSSPTVSSVKQVKRSRRGSQGVWTCSACTFINQKRWWSNANCEVCEQPRPPTLKVARSNPIETISID